MSLNAEGLPQRRRGRVLELALLEAVWAELTERGYDEFTIDGAASRAGTSRAVLYRRWPSKQELVQAAIVHAVGKDVIRPPDTGSLRGDVIALLHQVNERRVRMAMVLFAHLGDFYRVTGASLSDVSVLINRGRDSAMDETIKRAITRGEIRLGQITERIARLPVRLSRVS